MPMMLGDDRDKGAAAIVLKMGGMDDDHVHKMPNGDVTGPEMSEDEAMMMEGMDMASGDMMEAMKTDNKELFRDALKHFLMIYHGGHE